MRKPYFNVTARCRNGRCEKGTFTVERKTVSVKSTDGHVHGIEHVVCPECRMWAPIEDIQEVK